MQTLDYPTQQLQQIRARISKAELQAGRAPGSVRLIGASKRQPYDLLREFAKEGLKDLGENYLQEALDKQTALSDLSLQWHFIGAIQSNKTALIARHFNWVHSVDREKIARRLAQQFVPNEQQAKLNILLQLNLDDEQSKAGLSEKSIIPTLESLAEYNNIVCRGFMLIPAPRSTPADQRAIFGKARELLEGANLATSMHMDTLSMGMSNDLEAAIAEGSTMIRIGTDLFGARAN